MAKRTFYPFLNLKEAVTRVLTLRDNLGAGQHKQEAILKALDYSSVSGASTRAIASLTHYGLLNKVGSSYEVSELAMRIIRPTDQGDSEAALQQAALTPQIFSELYDQYKGEQLPAMLENSLIHNLQMTDQAAKKLTNVFKKTLRYARLIDEAGQLIDADRPDKKTESIQNASSLTAKNANAGQRDPLSAPESKKLPSGIKISFPADLDLAVMLGEFADLIKALEAKVEEIRSKNRGVQDEKETPTN